MRFTGKIYKDGKFWIGEVPALDAITQGNTRDDVVYMVEDWIRTTVNERGMKVRVDALSNNQLIIQVSPSPALFGCILRQQRQKSGLSQADAAKLLGFKSVNSYAAYEQGEREPSLSKAEELLDAVSKIDKLKLATG